MMTVSLSHGELAAYVMEDMKQQVWGQEKLNSLEEGIRWSKAILLATVEIVSDSGLYTIRFYLPDEMVEGVV